MNKKNFYVGMGMGLIVGGCAAYAMRPRKHGVKSVVDKKLKTIQDNLKEKYDIAKKSVKKAYKLDLDVELKGKDDEDSNELTVYAVKIGGNWYLCNEDGYFLSAGY